MAFLSDSPEGLGTGQGLCHYKMASGRILDVPVVNEQVNLVDKRMTEQKIGGGPGYLVAVKRYEAVYFLCHRSRIRYEKGEQIYDIF